MTAATAELTQAELFDVFSNARRRWAVRYLEDCGGACDLDELVERVALRENDVGPDELTRPQRRRVYISLYQTHLPMLAEHGIVDWDPDDRRVELREGSGTFDPYLDRGEPFGRWHALYASLAAVGVVGFVAATLSVGPLSPTDAPIVALALAVGIFALALVHHASERSAGPSGPVGRG
ncbi:hypothetical protein [Saliphagus sp. LR7]|uniref:DUF7344 domain-containing protein n=1 Tax=Saliphagus sp. LR7 TaxID=2282654 RepID=UPI000DF7CD59|nr:hypothetical protein [Saliphagus sp. LR7]